MTTIFYTHCKKMNEDRYQRGLLLLSPFMRENISKYRYWQDAHASLYGKLLLIEGMRQFGFNYSLDDLQYTEFGKPYFLCKSLNFNISHSNDFIACVISNEKQKALGIDLEKISPIGFKDFKGIWSEPEKIKINNLADFYTYWTRKEAVIKADGRGLQIPLPHIDVTKMSVKFEKRLYFLLKVDIDKEYKMHLASLKKIEAYELQYSSLNWL